MTESPTDSWPTVETIHGGPPPYAPPPPPPPEPDRRFGAGMLLALLVLALAAAGVAIAYFLTHRDNGSNVTTDVTTTVVTTSGTAAAGKAMPNVTGEKLPAAKATLATFGIQPGIKQKASTEPPGTVLDQAPAAGGTLTRNTPVTLIVAKANQQQATTSTGATTTNATTTAPTTTAPTTTTASAPPPPTTATVPDVSNTKESAAVQSLNQAGILASLAFVPNDDPLGTVEGQAKQAGTTVPYHSHMQINISTGPGDKPKEQVPDVIGKPLQQALSSINGAHLRLLYLKFPVTSRSQAGKVVQQSPLGGAQAPQNAQVVVYLGAFSG